MTNDAQLTMVDPAVLKHIERQRNEARSQVIKLLEAFERLPSAAKAQFNEQQVKTVRQAQKFAYAWGQE